MVSTHLSHNDVETTHEWEKVIDSALSSMDALVALLSPDFSTSKWCDQEVGIAIGKGQLVIPVRLGLDPYGFIGKFQGLQGVGDGKYSPQIARDIADVLTMNRQTQKKMARGLVEALLKADSFAAAKEKMTRIERCDIADTETISRLEAAPTLNSQVRGARGVPNDILRIVQRWRERDDFCTPVEGE